MNTFAKIRTAFQESPRLAWPAVGVLLLCGLLLVAAVVPSGPTVTGTIWVNGELLEKGTIDFIPVEGTTGPSEGGVIEAGEYRIDKGLVAGGKYRVEIQGTRKTTKMVADPLVPGHRVPQEKGVVPPKFNQNSILVKEVTAGANTIDFELEGMKKGR